MPCPTDTLGPFVVRLRVALVALPRHMDSSTRAAFFNRSKCVKRLDTWQQVIGAFGLWHLRVTVVMSSYQTKWQALGKIHFSRSGPVIANADASTCEVFCPICDG